MALIDSSCTEVLTSILYPQIANQSFESVYEYDALDRLKTLKLKTNGAPETLYSNQYDVTGRLTQSGVWLQCQRPLNLSHF